MKKIIGEFKKFITKGNIVDMAVGVIVGSSFTAIVNALSNNILKPLINALLRWIFGANSLTEVYTYLYRVDVDGVPDLKQSIYIDWGAFINAIINFFLVAIVLFTIVKIVNLLRERSEKLQQELMSLKPTKEEKAELKKRGKKVNDINALKEIRAEKKALEEEAAELEKAKLAEEEAAAKAHAEYVAGADDRQEALLREIRDLLSKKG